MEHTIIIVTGAVSLAAVLVYLMGRAKRKRKRKRKQERDRLWAEHVKRRDEVLERRLEEGRARVERLVRAAEGRGREATTRTRSSRSSELRSSDPYVSGGHSNPAHPLNVNNPIHHSSLPASRCDDDIPSRSYSFDSSCSSSSSGSDYSSSSSSCSSSSSSCD